MFILITILLLTATALTLLVLRLARPHFRFSWLIAVGATFLAWITVLLWRTQLPISLSLNAWAPTELLATAPGLAADQFSWIYALSLVTLALATILTETVREGFPDAGVMAVSVGVCALGIVAAAAGNPLTLVLIWAALDLAELAATLASPGSRASSRLIVVTFAVHAGASVLLMLAQVISSSAGRPVDFASITPRAGLLLLAAAGLRLGVLPIHLPYVQGSALRRGVGTTIRLASAAASLILLSHVPTASIPSVLGLLILLITAAASLYASWMWLRAPDELAGRPFWIIGLAGLALFSALRGSPAGSAAWGAALILGGAALFLSSVQQLWLNRLLYLGAWQISALPFSLTASGWLGGGGIAGWAVPVFVITQALILAGFVRHALRPATRTSLQAHPAWTRSVYPVGIGLLLIMPFVLGAWGWDGALQLGSPFASIPAVLLAVALLWAVPRFAVLNPVPAHWLRPASNPTLFERVYQVLVGTWRWLGGVSVTISGVLEGEAGLMWTLLFLVLFILTIIQRSP